MLCWMEIERGRHPTVVDKKHKQRRRRHEDAKSWVPRRAHAVSLHCGITCKPVTACAHSASAAGNDPVTAAQNLNQGLSAHVGAKSRVHEDVDMLVLPGDRPLFYKDVRGVRGGDICYKCCCRSATALNPVPLSYPGTQEISAGARSPRSQEQHCGAVIADVSGGASAVLSGITSARHDLGLQF